MKYDELAEDYARHRRTHPRVLAALSGKGGLSGSSRVLEVGCGTANYTAALAASHGCECWGIDPSPEMLKKAAENAPSAHLREMRAEDIGSLPGLFDLVFSVDVIHHLTDPLAYFLSAHRVMAPGAKICTVTDSEWIIRSRIPLASHFPETVQVELARYPGIHHLSQIMGQAGFRGVREQVVEMEKSLTDLSPYRDKAFSSLHLIPEESFRRGLDRLKKDLEEGPIPCISRYLLLWGNR